MSTLLLVGHGSRDPRSAGELRALADRVRAAVSGGPSVAAARDIDEVRLAFLELSEPLLEDVLGDVTGEVVVVPLLLGAAFHARFDLPGRLEQVRADRGDLHLVQTDVLGPHPLLDDAVTTRARELVVAGCDGVVLAGTGSSRRSANDEVVAVGERVTARLRLPVEVAFVAGSAAASAPVDQAIARLRAQDCNQIGFVPWFLALGRLLDVGLERATELGVTQHASTLASDPILVDLVLARAVAAATPPTAPARLVG